MAAAKEKTGFRLAAYVVAAHVLALLLLLAALAAPAQAHTTPKNRAWQKSTPATKSLLSQPPQLLAPHQVKAPPRQYDASGDTIGSKNPSTTTAATRAIPTTISIASSRPPWNSRPAARPSPPAPSTTMKAWSAPPSTATATATNTLTMNATGAPGRPLPRARRSRRPPASSTTTTAMSPSGSTSGGTSGLIPIAFAIGFSPVPIPKGIPPAPRTLPIP